MKKNLLALALLGLTTGRATAQPGTLAGPWVEVNTVGFATPAGVTISDLTVLSPTFAWGLGQDAPQPNPGQSNYRSVRTTDAAGTVFDYRSVQGTASFQTANLSVPAGVVSNLTAFCGQYSVNTGFGGGEVIRTTNGGINWERITRASHFTAPAGFCNWAYAFDADHVVAGGDPNPLPPSGSAGNFEFQYTSNASAQPASAVVWTRATAVPPALTASEYLLVGCYAAVGILVTNCNAKIGRR